MGEIFRLNTLILLKNAIESGISHYECKPQFQANWYTFDTKNRLIKFSSLESLTGF